jgi:hypothetical protein
MTEAVVADGAQASGQNVPQITLREFDSGQRQWPLAIQQFSFCGARLCDLSAVARRAKVEASAAARGYANGLVLFGRAAAGLPGNYSGQNRLGAGVIGWG